MKNNAVLSEGKLIAQARRGNHEAFTELVQKHSGKIYGVSLRMLKNREDAEDNVQNVLVKAYNNLGRFEGQSQFSTWLFRITINEALMKLRRHKPERFVNPLKTGKSPGRTRTIRKSRTIARTTNGNTSIASWPPRRCNV